MDGTVTIQYYLSNIFDPIIITLHEKHRPEFIFMDEKSPVHHARIIIVLLWEAGVAQIDWPASP